MYADVGQSDGDDGLTDGDSPVKPEGRCVVEYFIDVAEEFID